MARRCYCGWDPCVCRPKMDALKRQARPPPEMLITETRESDVTDRIRRAVARKPGRPRLTEGEHPIGVKVNLPAATCKAIDDTGRKRSEYIRAAITEKIERER